MGGLGLYHFSAPTSPCRVPGEPLWPLSHPSHPFGLGLASGCNPWSLLCPEAEVGEGEVSPPFWVQRVRPVIEAGGPFHCRCILLHQARPWESQGTTGERGWERGSCILRAGHCGSQPLGLGRLTKWRACLSPLIPANEAGTPPFTAELESCFWPI